MSNIVEDINNNSEEMCMYKYKVEWLCDDKKVTHTGIVAAVSYSNAAYIIEAYYAVDLLRIILLEEYDMKNIYIYKEEEENTPNV